MNDLHLFIPVLLKHVEQPDAKPLAALDTWLSKARVAAHASSREHSLARLFGVPTQAALPTAALTYLADIKKAVTALQKQTWIRADPVHLQADQRFLRLFDADRLHLQAEEAQSLCQALNAFYADDEASLQFIAATPTRWYLQLTHHQQLTTSPLSAVRGAHVENYLPSGADARWWQARWNEIQMFLHQHPINEARIQQGLLSINSLWFWGEGRLPPTAPPPHWQQVFTDDALSIGLSHWTQTPQAPLPDTAQTLLEKALHGDVLCVFPPCYGLSEQLETDWFAPLLQALQEKRIKRLFLYPDNGCVYQLSRYHRWLFWRVRQRCF